MGAKFLVTAVNNGVQRPGHISVGDPVIDEVLRFWRSDFQIEPFGFARAGYGTTPFDSMTSAIVMVKAVLYFKYYDWSFIGEDGQNILTDADIQELESH